MTCDIADNTCIGQFATLPARTFDSVCIAESIEGVLAGQAIWGHIGNHDCACFLAHKGVSKPPAAEGHTAWNEAELTRPSLGFGWQDQSTSTSLKLYL